MMTTPTLPSGTVTFLFSDIEGSTRLLQTLGPRYPMILEDHRRLLRASFHDMEGHEVSTQGDSFFVVFERARDAVAAAVAGQRAIAAHQWPQDAVLKVRMGIHTGEALLSGSDYVGLDVHRAARISSVAYGGQVLLSETARALVEDDRLDGLMLRDLGLHRLKDLQRSEHLFQVVHPDLILEFPPLRSLDAMPNNLPVQLTSFVGREREMTEVKRQLATSHLVTLLGPGGAGKTRLALQVAAECLDMFSDGVWLAELAPIADAALVPQTVASTLGLREPGRPATESLLDFGRSRSLMLVLDNCEHVLSASAELCTVLLRQCPNLRIVATSREALGVMGEASYRVPPLVSPDHEHLPTPESLNQFAAIRLFVERAALYQPGFRVTAGNIRAIAEVCRRLDGIPLAIELAAARVKVLTVEQIAERLSSRFRLLTGGARAGLPHHQTLMAAMDWSYDLLSDDERRLFRRLAACVGGFTLEAAEGIGAGDGIAAEQVLDLLAHLVDKSLVILEDSAAGDARYRLLETVRQYGLDRLEESHETAAVRGRHRDYYLALVERAELKLHGEEQKAWLDRLELEHDNFRAAMDWCRSQPDGVETGLRLAGSLWWFWEVRGYWTEGRQWLHAFLSRAEGAPAAAKVKALNAAGTLATRLGELERAAALAQESLALSRELGDKRAAASCLVILGVQACRLEDFKRAETLGGESLNLSREAGDNWGSAWAQFILAQVAASEGNLEKAEGLLQDSLKQMRALGHQWGLAMALGNLGMVARDQKRYEQAVPFLEEALDLFRQLGDRSFVAYIQLNLGIIASGRRDYPRAAALYRGSLMLRRELQDRRGIATCLVALGCVAAGNEQHERAARLFGAAEAQRESTGATIPRLFGEEYRRKEDAVLRGLGEEVFRTAWAAGKAMTADQAMDFALADT